MSRRSALKKGLVAGTLVWATPVVQSIKAGPAFAAAHSNPSNCYPAVAIASDFNDTPISANDYIWFNAVMKLQDPQKVAAEMGTNTVQISFVGQAVDLPGGTHLLLPNTSVNFHGTGPASVTYTGGSWIVNVPLNFGDWVFFGGHMYKVPSNLPGKLKPVTWSGTITMPGGSGPGGQIKSAVSWKWAAAVYSSSIAIVGDGDVNPKPIDGNKNNPYPNSDHAGTPEGTGIKAGLKAGARGGGGSNYTGGYSGTDTEKCPPTKQQ